MNKKILINEKYTTYIKYMAFDSLLLLLSCLSGTREKRRSLVYSIVNFTILGFFHFS